jgi:hypothetical protein
MQIVAAAAVLKTFLMMVDLFVCFGKITSAFVNTSEKNLLMPVRRVNNCASGLGRVKDAGARQNVAGWGV